MIPIKKGGTDRLQDPTTLSSPPPEPACAVPGALLLPALSSRSMHSLVSSPGCGLMEKPLLRINSYKLCPSHFQALSVDRKGQSVERRKEGRPTASTLIWSGEAPAPPVAVPEVLYMIPTLEDLLLWLSMTGSSASLPS